MEFELLSETYFEKLDQFERENRVWFETLIEARPEAFYSESGVRRHIQDCVALEKAGRLVPLILLHGGEIIARANLKAICTKSGVAEVGYRVAEAQIGRGVASRCLAELIQVAGLRFGQLRLRAQVLDNNSGSRRVLQKHDFTAVRYESDFAVVNGDMLGCTLMERRPD